MINISKKKIYESIKKNIIDKIKYESTIKESTIIIPFVVQEDVQKYVDQFNLNAANTFQYMYNAADNSLVITTDENNAPVIQQMVTDIENKGFDQIAAPSPESVELVGSVDAVVGESKQIKESFVVISKDKKDPKNVIEKEIGTYNSEAEAESAIDQQPVNSTTRYIIKTKQV